MAKKSNGTHSELLHCDNCGEEYSSTYKRCPFCGARADRSSLAQPTNRFDLGERGSGSAPSRSSASRSAPQDDDDYVFDGSGVFDDEEEDDEMGYSGRRGGKRLADSDFVLTPTTIAGIIFSLAVIIAAILIVVNFVLPMVRESQDPSGSNNPDPTPPVISGSPSPSVTPPPDTSDDPQGSTSPSPGVSTSPSPSPSTPVTGNQPTSFSLTWRGQVKTEFTISDQWPDPVQLTVKFFPEGTSAAVTWTSSKPEVATVSANGLVTAVKKGNCVITATLANGLTQTCKVGVTISGAAASPSPSSSASPAPSPSASATSTLTLTAFGSPTTDFTISAEGNNSSPVQLKVTGASGTVTWTSSKPEVATVSANGTVTRVGKGTCTVTATDANGNTGSCIVRCG